MLTHSIQRKVFTHHIDFSRHVNNAVYVTWLEEARVDICEITGFSVAKMAELGLLPVLSATEIEYLRPLVMADVATISVYVEELGQASAWLGFEISNQRGELCAKARQKGLFIDATTARPRRIPPDMREAFLAYQRS